MGPACGLACVLREGLVYRVEGRRASRARMGPVSAGVADEL